VEKFGEFFGEKINVQAARPACCAWREDQHLQN
jgi:hypothetical protein